MAIILEGPDLGGKSTIGKLLSLILNKNLYHFGGPPKSRQELYKRLKNAPKHAIYDRHPCISERIYGQLPNRNPIFSEEYAINYLRNLNPLIFYCNPGLEYLESKLQFLKTKPHKKQNHVNQVYQNYRFIYNQYEQYIGVLKAYLIIKRIDFRIITENQLKEAINEYNRCK